MITLAQWLEAVNYKITEGGTYYMDGEYSQNSLVPNTHLLVSWDGKQTGVSTSVVFDEITKQVIHAIVSDYKANRSYRIIDREVYKMAECEIDDESWDGQSFIDLTVDQDFMEKMVAIMSYQPYDTRVQMELDMDDEVLFEVMKMAHARDITLNEFITMVIQEEINRLQVVR